MAKTYGQLVDEGAPVVEMFWLVIELHSALKAAPVKERVWRYQWEHDGHAYSLAMNGHLEREADGVPPMSVAVERDGWLAAMCDQFNGSVVGGCERDVVAAIQAATEQAQAVAAVDPHVGGTTS